MTKPLFAPLTESQLFVNALRECLGKVPLYGAEKESGDWPALDYVGLEILSRAAKPGCETCGGSGYFDGADLNMVCPCTGRPQRAKRGQSKDPRTISRRKSACLAR